jgi:hypothetical protein
MLKFISSHHGLTIAIGWFFCGVMTYIIGLVMRKLKNPDTKFFRKIDTELTTVFAFGPILFLMGIIEFFQQIDQYQSKETFVLRKFES